MNFLGGHKRSPFVLKNALVNQTLVCNELHIYIVFVIFKRRYSMGLVFGENSMRKFLHYNKKWVVFFSPKIDFGWRGGIGFLSRQNSTVVNPYGANKRGIGLYRCYGMHCANWLARNVCVKHHFNGVVHPIHKKNLFFSEFFGWSQKVPIRFKKRAYLPNCGVEWITYIHSVCNF